MEQISIVKFVQLLKTSNTSILGYVLEVTIRHIVRTYVHHRHCCQTISENQSTQRKVSFTTHTVWYNLPLLIKLCKNLNSPKQTVNNTWGFVSEPTLMNIERRCPFSRFCCFYLVAVLLRPRWIRRSCSQMRMSRFYCGVNNARASRRKWWTQKVCT